MRKAFFANTGNARYVKRHELRRKGQSMSQKLSLMLTNDLHETLCTSGLHRHKLQQYKRFWIDEEDEARYENAAANAATVSAKKAPVLSSMSKL